MKGELVSGFEFAHLDARVHLVWAVSALVLLGLWANRRRRAALQQFGAEQEQARGVARRRLASQLLYASGLVALVFAALGPRANPSSQVITTRARDLAICLDVSRSMLADDLKPSRLEHAKLELSRLADHLSTERVGLVLFAGEAVVRCPLTSNYSYFKTAIRNVGPRSVSQGGTHIGDAIRKSLADLLGNDLSGQAREQATEGEGSEVVEVKQLESYADILVITDGEDHDSYPVHAARLARDLGVGVFAVGLGSSEGQLIPVEGSDGRAGFVEYKGQPVKSSLDEALLTKMVTAAGRGQYLPVGTQHFDLVDFYEKTIRKADGRVVEEELVVWTEIYQPFVILGLLLVLLARAVPLSLPKARAPRAPAAAAVATLALLFAAPVHAQDVATPAPAEADPQGSGAQAADPQGSGAQARASASEDQPVSKTSPAAAFAAGNAAFARGDAEAAVSAYENFEGEGPAALLCRFNAGVALRSLGRLDAAIEQLERVSVRGAPELRRAATYLLGACRFDRGEQARVSVPEGEGAEDAEAAVKRLAGAARDLRAAVDFFGRVRPRGAREEEAMRVARTRLRQALAELARIAKQEEEQAKTNALADPARFLLESLKQVRERRRAYVALEDLSPRQRRVPCRRLTKVELEWRELVERLQFGLKQEPQAQAQSPGQTPAQPPGQGASPEQEEAQRKAREAAAQALGKTIEASRQAEGALRGLSPSAAVAPASASIEGLRQALLAQPLDLAAVTVELVRHQSEVARLLEGAAFVPKEQEEVAFLCQIYQAVQAQPAPSAQPSAQAGAQAGASAGLDEETAKKIREKGAQALAAARSSFAQLEAKKPADAKPFAEACLERLEELAELLPKPPPSLQERIQELLGAERKAREETDALPSLDGATRATEAARLAAEQAGHSETAGELAEAAKGMGQAQMQGQGQGQGQGQAAEAAGHLDDAKLEASRAKDALEKVLAQPALEATDRTIAALEAALEALKQDQKDQDPKDKQQQQQQDKDSKSDDSKEQDSKEGKDAQRLDPQQARRLMEEMDAERRKEEARLFPGGAGRAVEKDW